MRTLRIPLTRKVRIACLTLAIGTTVLTSTSVGALQTTSANGQSSQHHTTPPDWSTSSTSDTGTSTTDAVTNSTTDASTSSTETVGPPSETSLSSTTPVGGTPTSATLTPRHPTSTTSSKPPSSSTTRASAPPAPPPPAANGCAFKPSASTTGASGSRTDSGQTDLGDGAVLQNANVSSLTISGSNVTVNNVAVSGYVLITGGNVHLNHVTATGVGISSASGVVVENSNVAFGSQDSIHVTSDSGSYVTNVVLRYNYIHDARPSPSEHYDGTQVRGASGLIIQCSVYDAGAFQDSYNAAIYLENANGGDKNIVIANNWLYGYAWSIMLNASNVQLIGNQLGGEIHWGRCDVQSGGASGLVSALNQLNGAPISLCL